MGSQCAVSRTHARTHARTYARTHAYTHTTSRDRGAWLAARGQGHRPSLDFDELSNKLRYGRLLARCHRHARGTSARDRDASIGSMMMTHAINGGAPRGLAADVCT